MGARRGQGGAEQEAFASVGRAGGGGGARQGALKFSSRPVRMDWAL